MSVSESVSVFESASVSVFESESVSESGVYIPTSEPISGVLFGRQTAGSQVTGGNKSNGKRQTAIGFKCKLISMSIYNNNLLAFCISTARDFIRRSANAFPHGNQAFCTFAQLGER